MLSSMSQDPDSEEIPTVVAPAGYGRRGPPPGRPPTAFSVAQLVERITTEVRAASLAELERRTAALDARVSAELKTASTLVYGALAVNVVAALGLLTFARVAPAKSVGVIVLAVTTALVVRVFAPRQRRASLTERSPRSPAHS
jgi:hypothetical protein